MLSTRAVCCTFHLLKESQETIELLRQSKDEDDITWMCRIRDWCAEKPYYYRPEVIEP